MRELPGRGASPRKQGLPAPAPEVEPEPEPASGLEDAGAMDELAAAPMEEEREEAPQRELAKKADLGRLASAPPPAPPRRAVPAPMAMPSPGAVPKGAAAPSRPMASLARSEELSDGAGAGGGGAFGGLAPPEPEPEEIIDADAWLDYDALALPGNDSSRRGRLTRASSADRRALVARAAGRVEAAAPPGGPLDPLRSPASSTNAYPPGPGTCLQRAAPPRHAAHGGARAGAGPAPDRAARGAEVYREGQC
jgi:hypothetical protein